MIGLVLHRNGIPRSQHRFCLAEKPGPIGSLSHDRRLSRLAFSYYPYVGLLFFSSFIRFCLSFGAHLTIACKDRVASYIYLFPEIDYSLQRSPFLVSEEGETLIGSSLATISAVVATK